MKATLDYWQAKIPFQGGGGGRPCSHRHPGGLSSSHLARLAMLHRSARALVQHTPSYSRTAATTAVKRPAYTPRPRTSPASSSSPAASTAPAAAAAPAAAPVYRRPTAQRAAPAATASAPASTTSPATPLAASEPSTAQAAPPAAAAPASPASSLASIDALPVGPAMGSSQPVGGAEPPATVATGPEVDWATSYHGLSAVPFTREQADVLMRPLEEPEIEIKPGPSLVPPSPSHTRSSARLTLLVARRRPPVPPRDSVPAHPQQGVRARRLGHGSSRRDERAQEHGDARVGTRRRRTVRPLLTLSPILGALADAARRPCRLVSVARGEQTFFDPSGVPTASEGCKSNALMRCCKDLGIASELWCVLLSFSLSSSASRRC